MFKGMDYEEIQTEARRLLELNDGMESSERMSLAGIESNLEYFRVLEKQLENDRLVITETVIFFERLKYRHPEWKPPVDVLQSGECPPPNEGDPNCKHLRRADDGDNLQIICLDCSGRWDVKFDALPMVDPQIIDPSFPFNGAEVFLSNRPMTDEEFEKWVRPT